MNKELNVYALANHYAGLTINCMNIGNINRFKSCLNLSEKIYNQGSAEIHSAISSVYLATISTKLELKNLRLFNYLKSNLKVEYIRQLNTSGL